MSETVLFFAAFLIGRIVHIGTNEELFTKVSNIIRTVFGYCANKFTPGEKAVVIYWIVLRTKKLSLFYDGLAIGMKARSAFMKAYQPKQN